MFSRNNKKCLLDTIEEELPLINIPGVLGLHPNAEMGYFTKASRDIWNNLLKLQPKTGMSTNFINCFVFKIISHLIRNF